MKHIIITCMLMGAILQSARAQAPESPNIGKTWTLADCIRYGTEHNIGVQLYQLQEENEAVNLQTSRLSRLPEISASLNENWNLGRAQDREGIYRDHTASTTGGGIHANLPIFQGFRIRHNIKAGEQALTAATEDLRQARQDLSIQITGFYLNVLFNRELVRIREEQIRLAEELVARTRNMVEAGKTAESEWYNAQAGLEADKMALTEAKNAYDLAVLDLCQAIHYPMTEGFSLATPDKADDGLIDNELLPDPESISAVYANLKPAIRAAEARLEGSRHQLRSVRASRYPQLSMGVSYSNSYYYTYKLASGLSNASLADQLRHNGATSIGLSLSIPLFNRMATHNSIKQAKLGVRNQELKLAQAHLDLDKEVRQAWSNARAALQKWQSAKSASAASQKALEYEQEKYRSGRSSTYQYNQARQQLAHSLAEQEQARFNYYFRSKILLYYGGQTL